MSNWRFQKSGEGYTVGCENGDILYTFSAQWANMLTNMLNSAEFEADDITHLVNNDGHVLPFRGIIL